MTNSAKHNDMANAIRALAMDAVQKANSGHPGLPMGCADIATVLFSEVMKFDPKTPDWPDRDRFVLSAGHGSMLLYASLYLLGYEDMTLEDIENFRQLGSKTAGHPEFGHASGIETTTGPLGQGLGNSVGMAIAEAKLNAEFGGDLVDHHTYVIAGDGCLMEGISQESISLAGHLKLNKLVVIWDNNGITIDGKIANADSTDQVKRFEASGWNTVMIDGHDADQIRDAFKKAHASDRPTLIAAKTTIGYGSPNKAGTAKAHGSALGDDEIAATRKELGWDHPPFVIPDDIMDDWRLAGNRSTKDRTDWQERLANADAETRAEFERRMRGDLPLEFERTINDYKKELAEEKPKPATRVASQNALEVINSVVVETLGGSADLTGSNNTNTSQTEPFTAKNRTGRYMHYGIREHGMAAAMNGIALHKGLIPYGGTFLVFTDYLRPSARLSALMGQRVIYVMTHDSIGLGEDGPTHQPVEQLAAMRAIPNMKVFRPADSIETLECWQLALENRTGPSVLALTRQGLPPMRTSHSKDNLCARGAYTVFGGKDADAVIFASGSEVHLGVEAAKQLEQDRISARVVSVPSLELFHQQDEAYRDELVGNARVRVAAEAAVRQSWDTLLRNEDPFVGMDGFGASGKGPDLFDHFNITAQAIAKAVTSRL